MMQLTHPKVVQPKLEAFRPQVWLCWVTAASVKANSKLMPSASAPGGLGVHTFPKSISSKINIVERLEFELAYYDSAV